MNIVYSTAPVDLDSQRKQYVADPDLYVMLVDQMGFDPAGVPGLRLSPEHVRRARDFKVAQREGLL